MQSVESVLAHRDPASAAEGDLVQRWNISVLDECIVGRQAEMGTFFPQEVVSFVNRAVSETLHRGLLGWTPTLINGNSVKNKSPLRLTASVRP